ncbi:matrix-remodeling-associated protein 7-like isoform X2 [Homarus americanus]|uniref:Matrix-remodeling-associated protein 7-like n=1 Tax=Homarus americanus TaxID=6706 RepID=A0A8J5JKF6_HOMAM|nr:matrix-remodeling-associated protein 7-like isoform X2 [Homarus americanus]KAG7157706.1 Matrix-remodeling-associated protein 7-like [Homarus americanus]
MGGGYTNSQTWEAWWESLEVSWNNTSFIFLASVALSMALVVASWMTWSSGDDLDLGHEDESERTKLQDVQEVNSDQESEHEEPDEGKEEKSVEEVYGLNHQLTGEVKKVERRALERTVESQMTDEQRQAEREAQTEQLAAIFKMMQDQEDKFGQTTIDDIKDQMKLYCG